MCDSKKVFLRFSYISYNLKVVLPFIHSENGMIK